MSSTNDPARRRRLAVVLFNLGGPDSPAAIRPFLLNLFRDPAILRVPFFIRPLLARIITRSRLRPATENYALLGGRSPLLELTREQAGALEAALPEAETKCFIAMRYWHPFARDVAKEVRAWAPDHVVLLPLGPGWSHRRPQSAAIRPIRRLPPRRPGCWTRCIGARSPTGIDRASCSRPMGCRSRS